MQSNILIPKKIKIGFNKRNDTYTKKLAYIIYTDEKGKLRKEKSWESWRDKKIDPQDFDNEPISGFVLNKKVGGDRYGWNPRQTYCRVYDPRGFEFEITVPNLLWILENTNSIKGKGLEGEFVYGWSGTELLLIPLDSPDYKEIKNFTDGLFSPNKIGTKDMIPGATYRFSNGAVYIYLGRFPEYEKNKYLGGVMKSKNNFYFFSKKSLDKIENKYSNGKFFGINTHKTLPKIAQCIDDQCHAQYAEIMDLLEKDPRYMSPEQYEVTKVPYTFEEFKKHIIEESNKKLYNIEIVSSELQDVYLRLHSINRKSAYSAYSVDLTEGNINDAIFYSYLPNYFEGSLREMFDRIKPIKVNKIKKIKKTNIGDTANV